MQSQLARSIYNKNKWSFLANYLSNKYDRKFVLVSQNIVYENKLRVW